jgi:putative phage-type endonuclease
MKIHEDLVQGSKSWLKLREEHFNASEAPSVFGESKYKSRTVLLNEKKGVKEKVSDHLQKLFDKGHETEDKARDLLEFETAETFEPIVATLEVEGLPLLASLDGISEDHKTIFEHKLWNETLAENVRNNVLEPTYYWQLEQQLLVAGAERALFVVSDGTGVKREMMYYTSKPERRTKLIAGWHEFKKDLEAHEVKAKQEVVVAAEQKSFPLIKCNVEGSTVISNLGEFIPTIKAAIDERLSVVLETDQDFADTEAFVKNLKVARSTLKEKQTEVTNAFESYSAFVGDVQTTDTILQKAESALSNAVKANKINKKVSIGNKAQAELNKHLAELSETINKVQITQVVVDFDAAMKGKRSFEKMEEAVNSELAKAKIEANEIAQVIRKNLDSLTELAKDHKFLFSDHAMLLLKDNDDLVNLIKARITEHEEAEAERKRQEQERIEREAKEKAEREAKAKLDIQSNILSKLLKAEEKRIRDEESAKVEAEQQAEAERIAQIKANDAELQKREQPEEKPVEQRLAERFAEPEQETAQQVSTHDKLNNLMYALTKHAARNSFIEFLEEWGLSEEDYAEVKAYLNSNLGEVKTYL